MTFLGNTHVKAIGSALERGSSPPEIRAGMGSLRDSVAAYVTARLCKGGGFCFYRLEEPNGADTYYALATLRLLSVGFSEKRTVAFLQRMQLVDGSYESIYTAFYALKGLDFLEEKPLLSPKAYITRTVASHRLDVARLPAEVNSVFRRMAMLVELYEGLRNEQGGSFDEALIDTILKFHREDGGFGYPRSNITDTAFALDMLRRLSYPVEELGVEAFIRRCEIQQFGFTDVPGSTLSYMEYVSAGLRALHHLGLKPLYPAACIDFIMNCRNGNGGFARTGHGGIATLEYTYYAVSGLVVLGVEQE